MITIDTPDPHCIVWARATAALWGIALDHDLDEPVLLSAAEPCRIQLGELYVVADREVRLLALRSGHHLSLRFTLSKGKFVEIDLDKIHGVRVGQTATMNATVPTLRTA